MVKKNDYERHFHFGQRRFVDLLDLSTVLLFGVFFFVEK